MSEWSFWKNEYSTEANRIGVENAYILMTSLRTVYSFITRNNLFKMIIDYDSIFLMISYVTQMF